MCAMLLITLYTFTCFILYTTKFDLVGMAMIMDDKLLAKWLIYIYVKYKLDLQQRFLGHMSFTMI